MVVRHAEKPDKLAGIAGVDQAGTPDKDELSVRGWQRAGALVRLFNPYPAESLRQGLSVPGAIFATLPTEDSTSKRPLHTVTPLAQDLGLAIRTDFAVHQEKDLVAAALDAAAVVLISWHHERIPRLVSELGIVLAEWPEAMFDRVLVLDPAGAGWALTVVQQHLLPGDA